MNPTQNRADLRGDFALIAAGLGVLGLVLVYAVTPLWRSPPFKTSTDDSWTVTAVGERCQELGECVQVGDRLLTIGEVVLEPFDRRVDAGFSSYQVDRPLRVSGIRDGEPFVVVLPPEVSRPPNLGRVLLALYPLLLWGVGLLAAVFLRPRDERFLAFLVVCWTAAVWGASGPNSALHFESARSVYRVAIWIFIPALVHLHTVLPEPGFPRLRRLLPVLYGLGIAAAISTVFFRLPAWTVALSLLVAVVLSLSLLWIRRGKAQTLHERLGTGLYLFGAMVGIVPIVAVAMVLAFLPQETEVYALFGRLIDILLVFVLPIWPLSYLYALYKHSPGSAEFRANRLLGTYAFYALYLVLFGALHGLGATAIREPGKLSAFSLALSLCFVVAGPFLRGRFQRWIDRTAYGITHRPEELLGLLAAKIPSAADPASLRRTLESGVLPALMVRQSALYLLDEASETIETLLAVAVPEEESEPSREELAALRRSVPALELLDRPDGEEFGWVRVLVPLRSSRDEVVGLWLFGRRDPDDFYTRQDLRLLANLGNQIAPVVENGRLLARARAEVAENRRLQAQLVHSQKMEAIGRLSAGVAHDFNNLLSVILGYSAMLVAKHRDDAPLAKQLGEIRDAAQRAAGLTKQLLAFSRQQVMEPKVTTLNLVVVEVEKILRRLTGEDVEVAVTMSKELPPVRIDPAQMQQVLMNLVVNARDAMPDGGRMVVRTRVAELETELEDPRQPPIPPGRYAVLEVADDGVGIEPEVLQRIFEPYFTTKEAGKGTGLGLSIAYGIVEQSGGFLRARSRVGSGATFSVYLREADRPERPETSTVSTEVPNHEVSETILLVEDEESVRQVAYAILDRAGYRVLEATGGGEALELAARHPGRIDLLLSDVVMPRMKGPELARRLLSTRPEMRVLFISGYTEERLPDDLGSPGRPNLLLKPFTPDKLTRSIRRVLDEAT